MRVMKFLLIFIFFALVCPSYSFALSDNNKFGIHITDVNELDKANELVNSNGGQWGYITLLINPHDRDRGKWQDRMNKLADKKLIPLVRITGKAEGNNWMRPRPEDAREWATFLNSLYWPTKQKIVMIYNEPNHGYEWGGSVDPGDYARTLSSTIDAFKSINPDFFLLNAGFDASAPNEPPRYMDQLVFMDEMEKAVPGIFGKLDGWSSHSYPNPGFSGRPTDRGRGSIRTYEWELDVLKNRFKVSKDFSVYITETGWTVRNDDYPRLRITEDIAAQYIKEAYENVWLPDARVRAVIPFMLLYKDTLFSHFSWIKKDDSLSKQYLTVQSLQKTAGKPEMENDAIITKVEVPSDIPRGTDVVGSLSVKNIGNTIWRGGEAFSLSPLDEQKIITRNNFVIDQKSQVKPGESYTFRFTMNYQGTSQKESLTFMMKQNETSFGERVYIPLRIFIPPKVTLQVNNPNQREYDNVVITFKRGPQIDTVARQKVPTSGNIGTYQSFVFAPDRRIRVEVRIPNFPTVISNAQLREGENVVNIELPTEPTFMQRLFSI